MWNTKYQLQKERKKNYLVKEQNLKRTHTHTHTHTYIYIYIYGDTKVTNKLFKKLHLFGLREISVNLFVEHNIPQLPTDLK